MNLEPAAFLEASKSTPVIDVRSPAEYEKGHIPGAVNIPLYNNDERAEVGTIYKKSGRQAAIFRGLDIEGPKMSNQLKRALAVARNGRLLVHCWRGGMRSESMAWLFRQGGLQTDTLIGGYKAYRRYIRSYFGFRQPVVVLGGMTGSGKTEILQHIHDNNEQVIDMEGIAHHKGSAFGDIGQAPQPTNEQFENDLADEWLKLDLNRSLWLEDESRSIGTVSIPDPVYSKISRAPVIFIELPLEERVKRIVKEYAGFPKHLLEDAIFRIRRRLGGQNEKEAVRSLANNNFERAVEIMLYYYDKTYMNSLYRRKDIQVFKLNLPKDDPERNARMVLGFYNNHIRETTREDILKAADQIVKTVKQLQGDLEGPVTFDTFDHKDIKLTHFTHGLGCACKLRPQDLEKVLKKIPVMVDSKILVGTDTSDDAAVYRINDHQAIVQTLDFFTPIVDEPYHFGAIAAANALSDIYAMGGHPLFALNIVAFPSKRLPLPILEEILTGARDKANEAGISILGGHTVEDAEPKYGLVVTGIIDPARILKNQGAKAGDHLILTKPIGTGIISTATKKGLTSEETRKKAVRIMSALNYQASQIMKKYDVHACTDVTGFGLTGHLREMILNTGVGVEVHLDKVPLIEEAVEFAQAGILPGGTINNHAYVAPQMDWDEAITQTEQYLLCDAQTSGGLLIAVRQKDAEPMVAEMKTGGIEAADIGIFTDRISSIIKVVR